VGGCKGRVPAEDPSVVEVDESAAEPCGLVALDGAAAEHAADVAVLPRVGRLVDACEDADDVAAPAERP